MESFAVDLLSGQVQGVGVLDGGVAGERRHDRFFRVEHAARRVHFRALVGVLDGPPDATTTRVDQAHAKTKGQPGRPARSGRVSGDLNQQGLTGYEKVDERVHGGEERTVMLYFSTILVPGWVVMSPVGSG